MSNKPVTIKDEVTKPYDELTDEEKCIYNSGFKYGFEQGVFIIVMALIIAFFMYALITFIIDNNK